jgi:hypothetical protein
MIEYCQRLQRVSSKTLSVTSGKKIKHAHKYRMPDGHHEQIEKSIAHYRNLIMTEKSNTFSLRDYQDDIANRSVEIINDHGFVYLAMEVRTGKTLTALSICDRVDGVENVLFLTKKKAIKSITDDSDKVCPGYVLFVQNYESIHKLPPIKWDIVVLDEAHTLGAFPKPSMRAVQVADLVRKNKSKVILMSGTPTPESYSQMYHQVSFIPGNPFGGYKNFYRFADDYVKVVERKINGFMVKDYSSALRAVVEKMAPYTISYTQEEAGFKVKITETILEVDVPDKVKTLIDRLRKDLVVQGKDEVILGDTSVKLMSKIHQLYSGTVKFESGNSMVIDTFKAEFIRDHFAGKKLGIFYKFTEELAAIKKVFGDNVTTELGVFEDTGKHIALQIVSGREGISLRKADCLVFYNIDFSATSYWQARDRMTTKDREENKVFWVFSKGGIEHLVYKAVSKKKDYTVSHFKRDVLTL